MGDGQGNFNVIQTGNFGYGGVAIGDVNNDGWLDVGYGVHHNYSTNDFGDQLLEVALGDGSALNWTPWDDGLATNGEDWGMFGTDFADIDLDGDLDVGSISFGCCAGIHIYLNNLDGSWTQSWGFYGGNSDNIFEFGDFNNDGYPDFAARHQDGTIYFGDGTGQFTLMDVNLPATSYHGTSVGDVNNDGADDIAFVIGGWEGGVAVYTWQVENQQWLNISNNLPSAGNFELTDLADMDMDGNLDLLAFGNGQFTLWLGDGSGSWTLDAQLTTPPAGDGEELIAGGDLDHNGYTDFCFIADEGGWPSYQNQLHCFVESSVPDQLNVSAIYPHGSERFHQYSVQTLIWSSAVPAGNDPLITLEYSSSGEAGPWAIIAENIPNSGHYQWSLPPVNSDNCLIKTSIYDGANYAVAITSSPFTIIGTGILGDVNNDEELNVLDIVTMVNIILSGNGTDYQLWAGDLNGDGSVNVLDIMALLNMILVN